MTRWLLTAFEPFGGAETNASGELLEQLPPRLDGVELRKATLPVAYERVFEAFLEHSRDETFAGVLLLGEAKGRRQLSLERYAHNLKNTLQADNDGRRFEEAPIRAGGPAAHATPLSLRPLLDALWREGIPAGISHDAGGYVCNTLYYQVLDHLQTNEPSIPALFVHVPATPAQAAGNAAYSSLSTDLAKRGVEVLIQAMRAQTTAL